MNGVGVQGNRQKACDGACGKQRCHLQVTGQEEKQMHRGKLILTSQWEGGRQIEWPSFLAWMQGNSYFHLPKTTQN